MKELTRTKTITDSTALLYILNDNPPPHVTPIVGPWLHLSVVQFEGGVVVVGVVVHPLANHCDVAVDLLPPLLQRPILSTLPPTALIGPAARREDMGGGGTISF